MTDIGATERAQDLAVAATIVIGSAAESGLRWRVSVELHTVTLHLSILSEDSGEPVGDLGPLPLARLQRSHSWAIESLKLSRDAWDVVDETVSEMVGELRAAAKGDAS